MTGLFTSCAGELPKMRTAILGLADNCNRYDAPDTQTYSGQPIPFPVYTTRRVGSKFIRNNKAVVGADLSVFGINTVSTGNVPDADSVLEDLADGVEESSLFSGGQDEGEVEEHDDFRLVQ